MKTCLLPKMVDKTRVDTLPVGAETLSAPLTSVECTENAVLQCGSESGGADKCVDFILQSYDVRSPLFWIDPMSRIGRVDYSIRTVKGVLGLIAHVVFRLSSFIVVG